MNGNPFNESEWTDERGPKSVFEERAGVSGRTEEEGRAQPGGPRRGVLQISFAVLIV